MFVYLFEICSMISLYGNFLRVNVFENLNNVISSGFEHDAPEVKHLLSIHGITIFLRCPLSE